MQFSIEHAKVEENDSQKLRTMEMEELYNLIMPIDPNYDPTLCRDEFLRNLFAELGLPENEPSSSSPSSSAGKLSSTYSMFSSLSMGRFIRNFEERRVHSTMLAQISTFDLRADGFSITAPENDKNDYYSRLLESIQRSSLFFMFSRIISRLRIMHHFASIWGNLNEQELPHRLFSWSLNDFFTRRDLHDFVYLDVLVRDHTAESLDWAKFRIDVIEILRYFKFFYAEIFRGQQYRKLLAVLWETQQTLSIENVLEMTLETSQNQLSIYQDKVARVSWTLWENYKRRLSEELQLRSMEEIVRLPIEYRYIRGYYTTLTEMVDLKNNIPINQMKKELAATKHNIKKIEIMSMGVLNMYASIVADYKCRIEELTERFLHDQDYWDDQILMSTFSLSKIKEDTKDANERIIFMRERVIEVKKLIRQEQEEEIRRIENEQTLKAEVAAAIAARKNQRMARKRKMHGKASIRKRSKLQSKSLAGDDSDSKNTDLKKGSSLF